MMSNGTPKNHHATSLPPQRVTAISSYGTLHVMVCDVPISWADWRGRSSNSSTSTVVLLLLLFSMLTTDWQCTNVGRTPQERVITAHPRTVNRINWHPIEENVMLSASQDTTIKLWDRRGKNYSCQLTFQPRSESVRWVP